MAGEVDVASGVRDLDGEARGTERLGELCGCAPSFDHLELPALDLADLDLRFGRIGRALGREDRAARAQRVVEGAEQVGQDLVGYVLDEEARQRTVPEAVGCPPPQVDHLELDVGGAAPEASTRGVQHIGDRVERPEPIASIDIRRRSFCLLIAPDVPTAEMVSFLLFCASPDEREMFLSMGHPFFEPGHVKKVGLVLGDATDWKEVRELVTDSYCLLAPKKLVALLDVPPE